MDNDLMQRPVVQDIIQLTHLHVSSTRMLGEILAFFLHKLVFLHLNMSFCQLFFILFKFLYSFFNNIVFSQPSVPIAAAH